MNKILKLVFITGGILTGGCLLLAGYAVMSQPRIQLNTAQPRAQITAPTQPPIAVRSTTIQIGPSPQPQKSAEPTAILPTDIPQPTQAPPIQVSGKLVEKCPTMSIYEPKAGKVLIGVTVTLRNGSNGSLDINPLDFSAVDTEGFVYQPELGSCDEQIDMQSLSPGQALRGIVGFHVPPNTRLVQIQYSRSSITGIQAIGPIS